MLTDLDLKMRYRSSQDDLLRDFYLPCLEQSAFYSRAVGYFSSHVLAAAAEGLPEFISNQGSMRLIASPELSDEDVEAIARGYRERDAVVEEALLRVLCAEHPDPIRERLGFLAWMVANKHLEIKIALLSDAGSGIYHEKIGVFADDQGNRVVFEGSANESRGGLVANFESLLVFQSQRPGQAEVATRIVEDFEELWVDRTPKLDIVAFPEAAERELLSRYTPSRPPVPPADDPGDEADQPGTQVPGPPAPKELRPYQREAVASWFRNHGRGVLEMATGTGKTITALSLLTRLFEAQREQEKGLIVVVLCPFQHLVSQWGEEARQFGLDAVLCYRSRATWFDQLSGRLDECRQGARPIAMAIATNATFQTDSFQQLARAFPDDTLLIADEVHNVGAPNLRALLPPQVQYRLGLSATPERWYDDEGTTALRDYFGETVYSLGLEDAIALGALTPYDYYPVVVELRGHELDEYLEITLKIFVRLGQTGADVVDGTDPVLDMLLIRRARILALAEGKLTRLERLVSPLRESTHNLFYCGDGQVEYVPAGEEVRQLDAVVHILGQGLGMSVDSYTAETYLDQRSDLRVRFADGALQGLVAIRCLDEGIDIPETRRAFILASSSNPKQFIQRRGRILRPFPGKRRAEIFDFVTIPPAGAVPPEHFKMERGLVQRELERVALFARLALNGPTALAELESLRKRYNLLHIA